MTGAFARDLEHRNDVEVGDRPELRAWDWRKRPLLKSIPFYGGLALIPTVIFALLL